MSTEYKLDINNTVMKIKVERRTGGEEETATEAAIEEGSEREDGEMT